MSILEVKNLSIRFDDRTILEEVSFEVEKGDALALIGPNGAGKTTLFRALIGAISFFGEIKKAPDLRIGYVPQKIDLERDLPLMVSEFFALRKSQEKGKNRYSAEEVLNLVQLPGNFSEKRLSELSAGELQRVMIAWAIMDKPQLLLFDEPTASVDIAGQETIYELLHRLQYTHNLTLILISHDLTVVYRHATKVLCLNRKKICFGAPQEVLTPKAMEALYGLKKFYHHAHD
jgi:zinc transport system ATP-binding protein